MSETRQQITEGVHLITTNIGDTQIRIDIQNKLIKIVCLSIDLAGSQGVNLSQSDTLERQVEVLPRRTQVLATILLEDDYELKTSFTCSIKKVSPKVAKQMIKKSTQKTEKKIHEARKHFRRMNINNQDMAQTQQNIGHYIDPSFAPNEQSISNGSDMKLKVPVQWRRPQKFFRGSHDIFHDKIEPNDIKQGKLGDCWFMCALASLAERPALVERLFINKSINEQGFYQVWFSKEGEWVRVSVDDYFPCFPKQGPIFSRSHGNELWVLILEKAYAKLHGSYGLLRGGWASQGMMDLTGCPTLTFDFSSQQTQQKIQQDSLWPALVHFDQKGALISASTPGQDRWTEVGGPKKAGGLVPGHAYTVIQAKQALGNRLLNIRNPWGRFEWDGEWGDNSPLWTQEMKKQVNPVLEGNDGTFWMSYNDFIHHFSGVNICRVDSYHYSSVRGKFERKNFEGQEWVVPKWYYMIQAKRQSNVIIGLHQEDQRIFGVESRRSYLDLGIVVLDATDGYFKLYKAKEAEKERQVELDIEMEPGKMYFIWPRTSGCAISRPEMQTQPFEWFTDGQMHPLVESSLRDLFRKSNVMIGEDLSYKEFAALMTQVDVEYTEENFSQLLQEFPSHDGGLTTEGFIEFFREMFSQQGIRKLKQWMVKWGYDEDLFSVKSRSYTVTLHSDNRLTCYMKRNRGLMMTDLTNNMMLEVNSEKKSTVEGVNLHCLMEKSGSVFTYGVYNSNTYPVNVILDSSRSEGLVYSSRKNVNEGRVEAESWKSIVQAQIEKNAASCRLKTKLRVQKIEDN